MCAGIRTKKHLRDLGHQRFAIVTFKLAADGHCGFIDRNRLENSSNELNRHRVQGYLEVLDNSGPGVSVKIWEWNQSNRRGLSNRSDREPFKEQPRPTAITGRERSVGHWRDGSGPAPSAPHSTRPCGGRIRWDSLEATVSHTRQLTTVLSAHGGEGTVGCFKVIQKKGPLRTKVPTKLIVRRVERPTIQGSDQEREIHIR